MNFIRDRRDAVRRANEDLRNRDGGMDDEDSFASSAKSTQPWHELKANAAADLGAILGELAPPADLLDPPEEPTEEWVKDRRRVVDSARAGTSRGHETSVAAMDDVDSARIVEKCGNEPRNKLTSFSPGEGKVTADPLWMRAAFHREHSEEFTPLTRSKGSTPRRVMHGFPKSVTPPAPPPEETEFTTELNLELNLPKTKELPPVEQSSESEAESESDDEESPSWVIRANDTPLEPETSSVSMRDSLEAAPAAETSRGGPAAENSRGGPGPSPRIWAEGDDVSASEHEVDSDGDAENDMNAGNKYAGKISTNLFRDSLATMDLPEGPGVASSVAEIASSVTEALNSMETFQRIEQNIMCAEPVAAPAPPPRKFGDRLSGRRVSPAKHHAREGEEEENGEEEATSPTSPLPRVAARRMSPLEMERARRREREDTERKEAEELEARLERELAELPTRTAASSKPKTQIIEHDLDDSADDVKYDDVDEEEAAAAADAIPDDMPPPRVSTPERLHEELETEVSEAPRYPDWTPAAPTRYGDSSDSRYAPQAADPYHHQQVYQASVRRHHAAVGSGYGAADDVKQARLARVASAPAGARRPSPLEKVRKVAEKPLKCQGSYVAAAEEAEARKRRESSRRAALEAEAEAARREAEAQVQAQMGRRAQSADTNGYVPVFQPPGASPSYHVQPGYHSPPGYDAYGQRQPYHAQQPHHAQQPYADPHMQWHPDPRQYQHQAAQMHHPQHHHQQHWQQYPPHQHPHQQHQYPHPHQHQHQHHPSMTPTPQPATTPRKEGPKRVTPQGRRAPSGSGRRYAETAPPKPRVKFADTKEGRVVRELLGGKNGKNGKNGERYVNRVKSSTGSPTSLSLEEAKLLASLKRLDAHCLAIPPGSPMDKDPGYHDSPYVDPSMGGRRSMEETALMASLARLDTQLGGLGPPEADMREIQRRNGRNVHLGVMPHAAPPAVFGTPPAVHYGHGPGPPPVPTYEPSPVRVGSAPHTVRRRFEYQPPPLPPPSRRWRPPDREAGDVVTDHWGAPPPKVESARRGRIRTAVGYTPKVQPKVQTRHLEQAQGRIHGGRVSDYFY